jgi:formamidopyrimidine-DNA glycosylase
VLHPTFVTTCSQRTCFLLLTGVGNIYRAEILYKSRVHPEQPGNTLSRATFDVIWGHCEELLQRGFSSGSILTVDPEDAKTLGKPWTRR